MRGRLYEIALGYWQGRQAQEKDNEIYGKGASYYYKYRQQDARLGRFWRVDPLAAKYPYYSPYSFSGNRLVDAVEWEGLEPDPVQEPPINECELTVACDEETGKWKFYQAEGGEWVEGPQGLGTILPPVTIVGRVGESGTPWMELAYEELRRWNEADANGRARMRAEYLGSVRLSGNHAWCAAFVYSMLRRAGVVEELLPARGVAAGASAWLSERATDPSPIPYGAVVVFDWYGNGIADHVGFYIGRGVPPSGGESTIAVLHGNWGGNIRRTININPRSVMGFFYPDGWERRYLDSTFQNSYGIWPQR